MLLQGKQPAWHIHSTCVASAPLRDHAPSLTWSPRLARIVHIMTVPESLGFLRGQTAFMKARGHELHAVTSPGPLLDEFAREYAIPTHAVEMPRRITPLDDLRSLAQLVLLLRELEPDLVHAHTPKGGLLGMLAATLAGVPCRVYHMRGLAMVTSAGARRALLIAAERVSCALAREVICVSHSLREVAIDLDLVDPDKIVVLLGGSGNGVDAQGRFNPERHAHARAQLRAELGIPADALVVGFIGRLVRDKGVVELARAWASLRGEYPGAHLIVAGPEEERDAVPHHILDQLRQDPSVHMMGFTRDTPRVYAASDLITLPTYREGFPNVPLEAAAMGLPVVATRIPGCVDAVDDGVTGLLVPPRDALALTQALRRYMDDPLMRAQHGQAGRARVMTDFDQRALWSALAERYDQLLKRR
jgi:glycosyltransferase involved in cell wall biosynthesis